MRSKSYIIIPIIAYMLLLVGLYFGARLYVSNKATRLRNEAYENLSDFFAGQTKFVSIHSSGGKVNFEQSTIPEKPKPDGYEINFQEKLDDWNDMYNDIYKLYKLKWRESVHWSGWTLRVIEKTSIANVEEYYVYPYQVGYRRQQNSRLYDYMPSVQQAVDNAFDFHTTNEKSSYYKYITDEEVYISDIRRIVNNEYYCLQRYGDGIKRNRQGDFGYMQNGMCRVYNYYSDDGYYEIVPVFAYMEKDMINIIIWGGIILTILLLCSIIIEVKRRKLMSETLKDKLVRVSNPNNFVKPYDEGKVNAANEIYAKLQNIAPEDESSLKEVRKEISDRLGVNFINVDLLKELKKKCNPQNFTNPYDEEKVRIANILFSKLQSADLTVDELENIQNEFYSKLERKSCLEQSGLK